jgi:hypothetical protein
MSYNTLNDPNELHDPRGFIKAKVVAKFCSLGLVSSSKWFSGYIIIYDGVLKLYDHEDTVKYSPENTVLEITLDKTRRPSAWKRKTYAQNDGQPTDFYSFYIMHDSEWLGRIRELKIGTHDLNRLESLIRCVEVNTHNTHNGAAKR